MTYTIEDLHKIVRLVNDFEFFLEMVGLDPANPAVEVLQSDERYPSFEAHQRAYVEAWIAWRTMFHFHERVLWCAKLTDLKTLRGKVSSFIEALGPLMSPGITRNNSYEVSFDNSSSLFLRAVNADAGRGYTLNYVVSDSADPQQKNYLALKTSILPTMATSTRAKFVTILP